MLKCIQLGIVSRETGVADGSFLPSNVSWDSRYEAVETVNRSTIKYMSELEEELASMPGYRKPENEETEKKSLKSRPDPECGYIHQARKKGLGYQTEMTVDTRHGIITGVDCYPANQRESDIILEHLKEQPCEYQEIGLDGGYDIGAVHRGLELLGINPSAYYPSFYRNNQKVGTGGYLRVMRLRQIWAEGIFAVLKREHKLNKRYRKGGFKKRQRNASYWQQH